MSGRLVARLGMALCCSSMGIGCSGSGPGGVNGSQSTARATAGSRTGGSGTGATGGMSQTNGSGGNGTGLGGTGSTGGINPYRCEASCNLPGQFCDDAGQCVVCLSDEQCKSPQPWCFLDAGPYYGDCVQCLVSNQCSAGEVCSPQMDCVAGCLQTDSCGGGTPLCEPDSGMCVSCLSAAQCIGGLVCEQGQCMECTSDFECAQNYPDLWVCSPENNCVQCRIDEDCPEGKHCVGTGCQ